MYIRRQVNAQASDARRNRGRRKTSDQFPLILKIVLALILAMTPALALVACLIEEKRRASNAPTTDTTVGDTQ